MILPSQDSSSSNDFQAWVQNSPSSGCCTPEAIPCHWSDLTCLPQDTHNGSFPRVLPQTGVRRTGPCSAMLCAGAPVPPHSPSWWGRAVGRKSHTGCQGWSTTTALGGRGKPYGFKSLCLKGGCCLSLNFLLVGFLAMECINIENEQT